MHTLSLHDALPISHQKLAYGKQDSVLNPRFIAISPYINSIEVLKLVEEFNKTLL